MSRHEDHGLRCTRLSSLMAMLFIGGCSAGGGDREGIDRNAAVDRRYDGSEQCVRETLSAVIAVAAGAGSTTETLEGLSTAETILGGRGPRFDWAVQNAGEVTRGRVVGGNAGAQQALDELEVRLRGESAADTAAARLTGTAPSSDLCYANSSADPSPSKFLGSATPLPTELGSASVPDLALGCETILLRVAPRLLRDPNGVLQEMAATYGRAGDLVIDAAFNYSDDPRLDTDPEAVAREACDG